MAGRNQDIIDSEKLEFVGSKPRNSHIAETVRNVGYIGVMLNDDDFFNGVVWASNTVDRFESLHRKDIAERIVVPLSELADFEKPMLFNAYMLLLIYYSRKRNDELVESMERRLMAVAKFQRVPPEHAKIMRRWDEYMADVKHRLGKGDHVAGDMKGVAGTREIFDYYQSVVKKEQDRYRAEIAKETQGR